MLLVLLFGFGHGPARRNIYLYIYLIWQALVIGSFSFCFPLVDGFHGRVCLFDCLSCGVGRGRGGGWLSTLLAATTV